jgi:hypothetical protein
MWIYLPAALAVVAAARFIILASRASSVLQWVSAGGAVALSLVSVVFLYRIAVTNAYPTFMPHLLVAGSWVIVVGQLYWTRKSR